MLKSKVNIYSFQASLEWVSETIHAILDDFNRKEGVNILDALIGTPILINPVKQIMWSWYWYRIMCLALILLVTCCIVYFKTFNNEIQIKNSVFLLCKKSLRKKSLNFCFGFNGFHEWIEIYKRQINGRILLRSAIFFSDFLNDASWAIICIFFHSHKRLL